VPAVSLLVLVYEYFKLILAEEEEEEKQLPV
jgi:hypothetical protein